MHGDIGGNGGGAALETEGVVLDFIKAAADSGIISGVQVKLLNDLASTWCPGNSTTKNAAPSVSFERQAASGSPAAVPGSALPRHSDLLLPTAPDSNDVRQVASCTAASTSLPEAPQLHIQPLNLSGGLHTHQSSTSAPHSQHDGGRLRAALTSSSALNGVLPASDPAVEGLSGHAAALMALTSGMTGSFDAAGAAAAALLQSQTYNAAPAGAAAAGAPQQQQVQVEAGPGAASLELLQGLGYAAEAATPAAAAAAAAVTAGKGSSSRKQRFTREQHAAILESVERNYAQCPSRYTELVIKEMQARFPGIELNNACVRKIKFRATEANKLQQTLLSQQEPSAAYEQQEASDAAYGLVGLATAAAAAAAEAVAEAAVSEAADSRAFAADSRAVSDAAAMAAVMAAQVPTCTDQQEVPVAAAPPPPQLCQQNSSSPETLSIGEEPVAVVPLSQTKQKQRQQDGPQQTQIAITEATADEAAPRGAQPMLALKLPPAAGTTTCSSQAGAEDGIDSATAAAAEAMHLLACISTTSSVKQQPATAGSTKQPTAATPEAAAAAVPTEHGLLPAVVTAAAGGVLSSKRKREAVAGSVDCDVSTSGTGTSSPLSNQVAEALSAAAELTSSCVSAIGQLGVLQAPAAAAGVPDTQQQQQQQLMQQLQPHLQGHWGAGFSGPVNLLELQLQQQQQALQLQLGGGLGTGFAALQPQQQRAIQAPAAAARGAAAAAAAGHPPAAKRQRLSGAQMAELIARVKHHVQVNPERYTHCVIRDMKEKYPDLELNMGQIRKIKFRTLGNANTKAAGKAAPDTSSAAASAGAPSDYGTADGACAGPADAAAAAAAATGAPSGL